MSIIIKPILTDNNYNKDLIMNQCIRLMASYLRIVGEIPVAEVKKTSFSFISILGNIRSVIFILIKSQQKNILSQRK